MNTANNKSILKDNLIKLNKHPYEIQFYHKTKRKNPLPNKFLCKKCAQKT